MPTKNEMNELMNMYIEQESRHINRERG